jgi:DNA-binding CsgD family transcriptional regulator
LLVLAAAEPLGDPLLLVRAAAELGLSVESADPAEAAGLFQIRERCSFRHPLVRSAVYGAATPGDRRAAHRALGEATDSKLDADRRAWHRAQATSTFDDDVATELEQTAARAKARGGLAAAGAFLQRAAILTPDSAKRADRTLAAADVLYEAGAFEAVENLLRALDGLELDELQAARAERLSVQASLSLTTSGGGELLVRLLAVAERLTHLDAEQANGARLEALRWAFGGRSDPEFLRALVDVLTISPASDSGAVVDLMLRGWGQLLEHGFPAGTDLLGEALVALRDAPQLEEADLNIVWFSEGVARSLWDLDSWETLTRRGVQLARDVGALSILPGMLGAWACSKIATGEFPVAALAVAESQAITDATGANWEEWADAVLLLGAWQFGEADALRRIDELERRLDSSFFPEYTRALVYNAAGRYERAFEAAQSSCERHPLGTYTWALVELVEAASRCGQEAQASAAFDQLADRTRFASTEWALGLEARSRAQLSDDPEVAERLHVEAIERLERARTRPDLARAYLLYGEWLRREGRRLDARAQLRTAYDLFSDIGIPGFAERARRELAATGETARKRTDETRGDLTAQESQIAQLASDGLTNPEIGAKLFLSPRTIEWHLRRIYPKLGVSSRKELRAVLHPS